MVKRFVLFLLLAFSFNAGATNWYVAQSSAGSDTGVDAANAHSMTWLNTSGNWGVSGVNSGDTVHLVGTLTSQLAIQGSGASNAVVTILFEAGAKFSSATWSNQTSAAAIRASGKNWITIDGGSNGRIEATDNGTAGSFNNSADNIGVYVDQTVHDWTIKNLVLTNLYRRTSTNDALPNGGGYGVEFVDGGYNITIQNCKCYEVRRHYNLGYVAASSNYFIISNLASSYSEGFIIGNANSLATLTNCLFGGNETFNAGTWGGVSAIHCDGLHAFAVASTTSYIAGLRIYGNYCHGDPGVQSTAYLYIEGSVAAPWIYNNLVVDDGPGFPNVGYLDLKSCTNAIAANNTFVSLVPTNFGNAIATQGTATNTYLTNNLFYNVKLAIFEAATNQVASSDNNLVFPSTTLFSTNGAAQILFSVWQAAGYDSHSVAADPLLVSVPGNYSISANSPAIGAGANMSSFYTVDLNGTNRAAWDIGAFAFVAAPVVPIPLITISGATLSGVTLH
jgi:hypothetical protein